MSGRHEDRSRSRAATIVAAIIMTALWPAACVGAETAQADAAAGAPAATEFFEAKIRPLLAANCHNCHSANTNSRGGLRVDDRNGLLAGGDSGPAIVPGKPEQSLLIRAVERASGELKMPPDNALSAEQVADLRQWIAAGAAWPQVELPAGFGKGNKDYDQLRQEHWSWQPLGQPVVPAVKDLAWPRDDIDRFILSALEARDLQPVGDADRAVLARRLYFDLTGLPPTPEEIDEYVNDGSLAATEKLVDRLLASRGFAERWARHWLDVARYGESTGSSRNLPYPHAWRYRDYVLAAFDTDKPYDQFIREQIAGDLLPTSSPEERAERLIATGFLAIGVKDVNQRFKVRFVMDNVDEQIDTVSRSVLGLSASCARCHDHKFDPIPTSDYYALAGIFTSTDLCAGLRNKMGGGGLDYYDQQSLLMISEPKPVDAQRQRQIDLARENVAAARKRFQALRDSPFARWPAPDGRPYVQAARQWMNKQQNELRLLTDPVANGADVAMGARDAPTIGDTQIRVRGEAEQLGPAVPRGFLGLVSFPNQPQIDPRQSGRLQLAQWLTSEQNALALRVIVNRVWSHLFGQGIVKTVDNFGSTGEAPSHPELLDHLAARFVRQGWSIKRLVRMIVLTRAYQLDSAGVPSNLTADPKNRLLWRHSPRRLDAEEIRDAMLLAAGSLDRQPPPASPARPLPVVEINNNGAEAKKIADFAAASRHRSVYLPLVRDLTPWSLKVFDFAQQGLVTGRRELTTVAPQSLFLLNDSFVLAQSQELAKQLVARAGMDDEGRVDRLYRLALGRPAAPDERQRALAFLGEVQQLPPAALAAAVDVAVAQPAGTLAPSSVEPLTTTLATDERPAASAPDAAQSNTAATGSASDDLRARSWALLSQAIFASAEFRYVK